MKKVKHKTLGIVMRAASWVYVAPWCVLLACSVVGALFAKAPEGVGGMEGAVWMGYAIGGLLSGFGIISAVLLPLSVRTLCKSGGRRAAKRLSVIAAVIDNVLYLVFCCLAIGGIGGDRAALILLVWIIVMLLCIVLLACSKVRDS